MRTESGENVVCLKAKIAGPMTVCFAALVLMLIFLWTPHISAHYSDFPVLANMYWVVGRYALPASGLVLWVFELKKRFSGRCLLVDSAGICDRLSSQRLGAFNWSDFAFVYFVGTGGGAAVMIRFAPETIEAEKMKSLKKSFSTRLFALSGSPVEPDFVIDGLAVNSDEWEALKKICPPWVRFY